MVASRLSVSAVCSLILSVTHRLSRPLQSNLGVAWIALDGLRMALKTSGARAGRKHLPLGQ